MNWVTIFRGALSLAVAVSLAPVANVSAENRTFRSHLSQPSSQSTSEETSNSTSRLLNQSLGSDQHSLLLELEDGSELTLITPKKWLKLGQRLGSEILKTHFDLSQDFGSINGLHTTLKLMDEDTFYLLTGAPSWTNALYYRGQILIPLGAGSENDISNLSRSVRHEYTHAVTNSLSHGRCPGWLDEGLAQAIEGSENPALKPALLNFLAANRPVPLSLLQGGFTRLKSEMVAAAYAQSLFAARSMVATFGYKGLRGYFDLLKSGASKEEAFRKSFQIEENYFVTQLVNELQKWSNSYKTAPQPTFRSPMNEGDQVRANYVVGF